MTWLPCSYFSCRAWRAYVSAIAVFSCCTLLCENIRWNSHMERRWEVYGQAILGGSDLWLFKKNEIVSDGGDPVEVWYRSTVTPGSLYVHKDFTNGSSKLSRTRFGSLPLMRAETELPNMLRYTVPSTDCKKYVVPRVRFHPKWGYIYQGYCAHYHDCSSWYVPGEE